ncbi:MAG TPA: tRNA (adenosine(37)-N6)-threonylcarbamoyltransferase complex transferase subunit TsaD, partial [Blastocatellia bacterium]|nr:tRNA (adenosine(37)-N6)-threonylcarbamoyltransferase complex transferase subunit TsaD [Blastocatellia bacterium]
VSGGHTTLFYMPQEGRYAALGRTRDDAAGEAYDKVAKLLGLSYPGGPVIDRLAQAGDPKAAELVFTLPRMDSSNLDFSFSGLKTAVLRYVKEKGIEPVAAGEQPGQAIIDLAASFQDKVVRSLLSRLKKAASRHRPKTIILAGGVACNSALRAAVRGGGFGVPVYYPSLLLSTDNAAMIAAAGSVRLARGEDHGLGFTARASMKLENFTLEGYEVPRKARYKI